MQKAPRIRGAFRFPGKPPDQSIIGSSASSDFFASP
jgi:hypothetical protein